MRPETVANIAEHWKSLYRKSEAECARLRESNARLLEAPKRGESLLSHFRGLVIEGQVTLTNYATARQRMLPNDYETLNLMRKAIAAEGEK